MRLVLALLLAVMSVQAHGQHALEIIPLRHRTVDQVLPGGQFQRAATTVSGRLGEWFEIGGAATSASRDDRGILSAKRSQISESRRIWVKVEELK